MKTQYIGKTIGNRVLAICQAKDGSLIQCPHVDLMDEDDLCLVRCKLDEENEQCRYLTDTEVACFITGKGLDGKTLETPAEMRARHKKEHAELMKDPQYKKIYEQLVKEMAE